MQNAAINKSDAHFPDIETASKEYERRFSGTVGQYFLERQTTIVTNFLPSEPKKLKILEVGGGHCQLTEHLLKLGHEVWVQGSDERALWKIGQLSKVYPNQVHSIICPFNILRLDDDSFDVVISIRLMSHITDWKSLVAEMCRLAKNRVIIDFPPKSSFNIFYPLLFKVKKFFEKDTRPFKSFTKCEIRNEFRKNNFERKKSAGQFFMPMVIHRYLNKANFCKSFELLSATLGLTKFFGSPMIFAADKKPQ